MVLYVGDVRTIALSGRDTCGSAITGSGKVNYSLFGRVGSNYGTPRSLCPRDIGMVTCWPTHEGDKSHLMNAYAKNM